MAKSLENETKKLYVAMNEDGSGKISQEELKILLHDKSVPMAANEITNIMQEMNVEDSRSIDIMQFLIMVSNLKEKDLIHQAIIRRAATKKAIKKAFRELDQDKDGYISKSEFKRAVQKQKLVKAFYFNWSTLVVLLSVRIPTTEIFCLAPCKTKNSFFSHFFLGDSCERKANRSDIYVPYLTYV